MAKVSNKLKPRKGTPPAPAATTDNLTRPASGKKVPLQVEVAPEIKMDFRAYAAARGMYGHNLFVRMFEFYKERNP